MNDYFAASHACIASAVRRSQVVACVAVNFDKASFHLGTHPAASVTRYGYFAASHFLPQMHSSVAIYGDFALFHAHTNSSNLRCVTVDSYVWGFRFVFFNAEEVAEAFLLVSFPNIQRGYFSYCFALKNAWVYALCHYGKLKFSEWNQNYHF